MNKKTAAELKIDRLYHYDAFDKPERLARMFTEGAIYFSRPKDVNDPWDCRPCFSKSLLDDSQEYERIVGYFVNCGKKLNHSISEKEHLRRENELLGNRKLLEFMIDEVTSDMDQVIQKQYRIYCLSTDPKSILMWAHYANSCKGICLEFSVKNYLFCGALKVDYVDSYPSFNVSDIDEDSCLQPLLVKSNKWKYEDEFSCCYGAPFRISWSSNNKEWFSVSTPGGIDINNYGFSYT